MYRLLLLNPARPGGSTRWLDRSGFNKRPAVATARPNPGDPELGRTRTRPGFFFFFQMWDLKPISIYTLCSHKKTLFFQYGIKTFWFKYFNNHLNHLNYLYMMQQYVWPMSHWFGTLFFIFYSSWFSCYPLRFQDNLSIIFSFKFSFFFYY